MSGPHHRRLGPATYESYAAYDPHHPSKASPTSATEASSYDGSSASYSYDEASYDEDSKPAAATPAGSHGAAAASRPQGGTPQHGGSAGGRAPASAHAVAGGNHLIVHTAAAPPAADGSGDTSVQIMAMGAGLLCACILYPICARK